VKVLVIGCLRSAAVLAVRGLPVKGRAARRICCQTARACGVVARRTPSRPASADSMSVKHMLTIGPVNIMLTGYGARPGADERLYCLP